MFRPFGTLYTKWRANMYLNIWFHQLLVPSYHLFQAKDKVLIKVSFEKMG